MKSQWNKFREFILACILTGGATALVWIAARFVVGIYLSTFSGSSETIYLNFRGDGEPYLTHYVFSQSFATQTDLDGTPITVENEAEFTRAATLSPGLPHGARRERQDWNDRILGFKDNQKPPVFWYLIHDGWHDGQAYFVGYSAGNRARVGYIGTAGFREQPIPPSEQFTVAAGFRWGNSQVFSREGSYNRAQAPRGITTSNGPDSFDDWIVFLNSQTSVYEVNLAKQSVRTVLADSADPVKCLGLVARGGNTLQRDLLVMRSADKLHLLDSHGETKTIPLAPELRGRELEMVERPDGGYTVAAFSRKDYDRMWQYLDVYVMAPDGTLGQPHETHETLQEWSGEPVYLEALPSGSPALMAGALASYRAGDLLRQDRADSYGQAIRMAFSLHFLPFLASVVAGAALAIVCYRRQALHQRPLAERIFWPVYVFLMGLPGWIGYRYSRHWPVIEPCPSCHEPTPRDDEACTICGNDFPQPEAKGTEIFA